VVGLGEVLEVLKQHLGGAYAAPLCGGAYFVLAYLAVKLMLAVDLQDLISRPRDCPREDSMLCLMDRLTTDCGQVANRVQSSSEYLGNTGVECKYSHCNYCSGNCLEMIASTAS
jgi:hypothetical protein